MRVAKPVILVVQMSCGVLLGLLLGWLAGLLSSQTAVAADGLAGLARALSGALLGYTLGVFAGIYLAARLLRQIGSLPLMITGAVAGVMLVLLAAEPLRLNRSTDLLLACLILLPPALATVGFHARPHPST
jgi:hypothetical protein